VGLFSFVGKALGAVAKTALGFVPGGGVVKTIAGVAGNLLQHKTPMQTAMQKYQIASRHGTETLRGKVMPRATLGKFGGRLPGGAPFSTPVLRAASPVMPGGSIATPQGIMAPGGGVPPATYGGRRTGAAKKKRRSSASRRSSSARSSGKRKSGKRKLKFGSAAYRKKYLKHRR